MMRFHVGYTDSDLLLRPDFPWNQFEAAPSGRQLRTDRHENAEQ